VRHEPYNRAPIIRQGYGWRSQHPALAEQTNPFNFFNFSTFFNLEQPPIGKYKDQ
jgi:hypothetical protein